MEEPWFDFNVAKKLVRTTNPVPVPEEKLGYYLCNLNTGQCLDLCFDWLHRGATTDACKHNHAIKFWVEIVQHNKLQYSALTETFLNFLHNRETTKPSLLRNQILLSGSLEDILFALDTGVQSSHMSSAAPAVVVWDVSSNLPVATLTNKKNQCVKIVAFSPDGQALVAVGEGAQPTLSVWELYEDRVVATLHMDYEDRDEMVARVNPH